MILSNGGAEAIGGNPQYVRRNAWVAAGALLLGFLAMFAPTYAELDRSVWNVVGQGHGPVMLALALWLAYQRWPRLLQLPEASSPVAAVLLACIGFASYVLGRSQDILALDVGAQIPLMLSVLLLTRGWRGVRLMALPILFIFFVIPLPSPLVDAMTGPLKMGASYVAEHVLYQLGYPIGREGVMLTIGTYRLMVADACAGLNSIFALEAVGVFYISIIGHTNIRRNLALALLVLPITFISNVGRVVTLVLITYYFGDGVGQSFVHEFAGIFLFVIASVLLILLDSLLGLFMPSKTPSPASEPSNGGPAATEPLLHRS
jgi:exosortase B